MAADFMLDYRCQPKQQYGTTWLHQLSKMERRVRAARRTGPLSVKEASKEYGINPADMDRALAPLRAAQPSCLTCPANFVARLDRDPVAVGCWASLEYPIDETSELVLSLLVHRLAMATDDLEPARSFLNLILEEQRKITGLSIFTLRGKRGSGAPKGTRFLGQTTLRGVYFDAPEQPFRLPYPRTGRYYDIGADQIWQLLFLREISADMITPFYHFVTSWLEEAVRLIKDPLTTLDQRDAVRDSVTLNGLARIRKLLALAQQLSVGVLVEY